MRRTEWLQETLRMRSVTAYGGWQARKLTQKEAGRLLGVDERTFRRYVGRYEDQGLEGLRDKRLTQTSARKVPGAEVQDVVARYQERHRGWNVKHFYSWYQRDLGGRSYSWVKTTLQEAGLVQRSKGKGAHRKKRERSPLPGMMVHQDASTHEWVPGKHWDLVVTMDDATSEHYSMVFVEEEGTQSSFLGVQQTLEAKGLFCSLYTDRGSHYWYTSEAGGKVDKKNLTEFGRAMHQLGIELANLCGVSDSAISQIERAKNSPSARLLQKLSGALRVDMEALLPAEAPAPQSTFTHQAMNHLRPPPARHSGDRSLWCSQHHSTAVEFALW